ncbi:PiggyBac transposable element-derived protein 4-like [Plakobranchus ocellatus]|uniref:PiggyBac transposable element-derived protein 4-like n=1 Tax=Plakobranchus ocellatus TaxID=259542 RepID=A0AAV3Z6V8_9GAST|nr:PiggyBac transposable element-derived protein 4-like [Plakobranchus ocellatus]
MAFNFMQSLVRQSIDTDTNVNLGTSVDEEEGDIDDESDVEFGETDGLDLDLDQEQGPADNENRDQNFDPDNAGKSNKWWRCCFCYLIEVSLVNAYIVYKNTPRPPGSKPMPHFNFHLEVARSLFQEGCRQRAAPEAGHLLLDWQI